MLRWAEVAAGGLGDDDCQSNEGGDAVLEEEIVLHL